MPYTAEFFKARGGSARDSAEVVLPIVFAASGVPRSILDVGCGTGGWLAAARRMGVSEVLGVDGYAPPDQLEIPSEAFRTADLTEPLELGRRFDFVITVEVAEHLPADAADIFVDSLVRHGNLVLFSAAIPGQGGNGHVNEQPPGYWVDRFSARGFELFDLVRYQVWDDKRVEYYYRQNLLLFAKGDPSERLSHVAIPAFPLHVVHPETLCQYGLRAAFRLARRSVASTFRQKLGG